MWFDEENGNTLRSQMFSLISCFNVFQDAMVCQKSIGLDMVFDLVDFFQLSMFAFFRFLLDNGFVMLVFRPGNINAGKRPVQ